MKTDMNPPPALVTCKTVSSQLEHVDRGRNSAEGPGPEMSSVQEDPVAYVEPR